MKTKIITATLLCATMALTSQVQAQDTYRDWLGISDDWNVATNWQNGIIPSGPDATARIYNSTTSSDPVAFNTVLKAGPAASLKNVWIGNSNDAAEAGNLTVESGASLTTTDNFILENNSVLTSSGAISVVNANGMIVRDSSSVTLKSGSTLNKLTLQNNSTATLESGSSVTTISNLANSSQLTLSTTYTGDLTANNSSVLNVNGTLNGNFGIGSDAMQSIGATGVVNGNVEVSTGDQITIAGEISGGQFSVNGTGMAVIESTADIKSDSAESWIYNTAAVTWNVGADGSVGTLRTNRSESSLDAYDGEWRYDVTAVDMIVNLDDFASGALSLQLVSGIQNESTWANNVTFMKNGSDVTSDFSWDGAGTGAFTGAVIPEPSSLVLLGLSAAAFILLRRKK